MSTRCGAPWAAATRGSSRAPGYPDREGFVERDGVRVFWEVYGEGERAIVLLPTWSIVHSRMWKAQIPYLARHVRGGRRSTAAATAGPTGPTGVEPYAERRVRRRRRRRAGRDRHRARDRWSGSRAARCWATAARRRPSRASRRHRLHRRRPSRPRAGPPEPRRRTTSTSELDTDEGWAKYNRHYWRRDYRGFLEFFFGQVFTEPHSTKQIEDCVGWALDTTPETLRRPDGRRRSRVPTEAVRGACVAP